MPRQTKGSYYDNNQQQQQQTTTTTFRANIFIFIFLFQFCFPSSTIQKFNCANKSWPVPSPAFRRFSVPTCPIIQLFFFYLLFVFAGFSSYIRLIAFGCAFLLSVILVVGFLVASYSTLLELLISQGYDSTLASLRPLSL